MLTHDIAIFLQKPIDTLPDSNEPRPILKLKQYILESNGWKTMIINWKEFSNISNHKKKDYFMEKFNKLYEKQVY